MFMLIIGIALHGLCYDFFFVTGQIYTDSKAGEKFKSSAQGLITLATYGIGMLIGFWAAGLIADFYTIDGQQNWEMIWIIPAVFAVRSEEHTSELQSRGHLVCRLLLEKKKQNNTTTQ